MRAIRALTEHFVKQHIDTSTTSCSSLAALLHLPELLDIKLSPETEGWLADVALEESVYCQESCHMFQLHFTTSKAKTNLSKLL